MSHAAAAAMRSAGLVLALLGCVGPQAAATVVYRCGPNLYSQHACEGGRAVHAADPRSAEQLAQARKSAADQSRLAHQMRSERLAAERMRRPGGAAGIEPVGVKRHADEERSPSKTASRSGKRSGSTGKPKAAKEFVAFVPRSGSKAKQRAAPGAQD